MSEITAHSIKGYRLLDLIGEGAFGAVYRAHQEFVEREVAIKIILPEHANRPDFIRRLTARLSWSPNWSTCISCRSTITGVIRKALSW